MKQIQSYDHNVGNFVRVLVGTGQTIDGTFVFDMPQQFQTYIINDAPERRNSMTDELISPAITDYSDLVAMGGITLENLWTIIDRIDART